MSTVEGGLQGPVFIKVMHHDHPNSGLRMRAGLYAATAGCDNKVVVWHVPAQRCLATRDSGAAVVSDLAWQVHMPDPEL